MEFLYRGKFINLVREGRWEFCERVRQTSAVMIFARTQEGGILLVEEYRPPIARRCICFPAGLIGDAGSEDAETASRRELLEETGYEASEMRFLYDGPSSPGITSEYLSFFLATGLVKRTDGGGVQNERITVHVVPEAFVDSWLDTQRVAGKAVDPRVYAGLYALRAKRPPGK